MNRVFIDSFSNGRLVDLKRHQRTPEKVLECLKENGRVSVWDMDTAWIRNTIMELVRTGKIADDKKEPYPWIRYKVLP